MLKLTLKKVKRFSLIIKLYIFTFMIALQFVEDYLTTYKMLPGMRICDGTWIEFIGEVTER